MSEELDVSTELVVEEDGESQVTREQMFEVLATALLVELSLSDKPLEIPHSLIEFSNFDDLMNRVSVEFDREREVMVVSLLPEEETATDA